ncbi:uncharacterized protein LOC125488881 [Plutella xylostella]|uniref:uncharacterized protein LOC125488881 n=1 Tax=Plutella xylostella TaxID=51655 RepID=UPI002032BBC8|nr:uncharacterized protein LOC125488881 [Plutella xylostella]
MENLKKERSVMRRLFTKAKNELLPILTTNLPKPNIELKEKYNFLAANAENMFKVDEKIKEVWLSMENLDEELYFQDLEAINEYESEWIKIKTRYEEINKEEESKYDSASVVSSHNSEMRRLRLPKLELPKFDGKAKNWIAFWSIYKKIHFDETIDDDDKFAYLIQAMEVGSPAQALIKSFPPCGRNYADAVEQLKARYARDELLIEIYVRELLSLVLQQAKGEDMNIASLYDQLKTQLRALETLGVTSEKYAAMLYPLVESALPADMLRIWERQRSREKDADILNHLLDFVKLEVESEERISITRRSLTSDERELGIPTASCLVAGSIKTLEQPKGAECIWCEKTNHSSLECYKGHKMTLKARQERVTNKKGCTVCLRLGHDGKRCRSYHKCVICQKRHAMLLCPELSKLSTPNKPKDEVESSTAMTTNNNKVTLLQTLLIKVNGTKIRAFIDTGAQKSYILNEVALKLKLTPTGEETLKHCLFGGTETKSEKHKVYKLKIENMTSDFAIDMTALSKNKICGPLPRVAQDSKLNLKLREMNIMLSDTGESSDEVGLLIGADYAGAIMTETFVPIDAKVTAIRTKLGWTIQGTTEQIQNVVINSVDLNDISCLWNLEMMGIEDPKESISKKEREKVAIDNFEKSVTMNDEGRYEVSLPWKDDKPEILSNKETAVKRLKATSKKLEKHNELENYDAVFKEWLALGIIEEEKDETEPGHYLPHQAVIKESSLTTRVRPVFDASARDYNGSSLNSCLDKGQNFLELIPIMLMRFRAKSIGITADIKKAFLQISLIEDDRKYLRFLWWKDNGEEIITYRHRRVVFGLTCSPFLLAATIKHHLNKYSSELTQTAQLLSESLYVDNCVVSVESQEDAEKFIKEAKLIMSEGKFELRGWITAPVKCAGTDEQTTVSILGVMWDTRTDELYCNMNMMEECKSKLTRRVLLSIVHRIFDPIGILSPTTVVPKLLLQRTWELKIGWDTELPEDISEEFRKWLQYLPLLRDFRIPRRFCTKPYNEGRKSLHVFCDSSSKAYATCVFVRTEVDDDVTVRLVMAKARVAPVKKITIPRLELMAAVMATRVYVQVKEGLTLDGYEVYFWSDSSVALTWIMTDGDWSLFVKNRVREIREHTHTEDWRYVSGTKNPADLPSRGCSPKKLLEEQWWEGPAWLKQKSSEWPVTIMFERNDEAIDSERSKIVREHVDTIEEDFSQRFNQQSNFTRIVRTAAWVNRFCKNCRANKNNEDNQTRIVPSNPARTAESRNVKSLMEGVEPITAKEFEEAEVTLYKLIQRSECKENDKGSNIDIFEGEDGLRRVRTRLTLSDYDETFKYPILLSGKHPLVAKLIESTHKRKMHAGTNVLAAELRNTVWITGARRAIRNITSKCVICKRFNGKSYETPCPPLPENRIKDAAPFQVTGVDAAGPMILKTGGKTWIMLFTCAIYRAIHIEVVTSMTTDSFLMALRRFIARRGRCEIIYSDNGTNFRGAENHLSIIDWEKMKEFSTANKIRWIFNPPAAPWWGGWWEDVGAPTESSEPPRQQDYVAIFHIARWEDVGAPNNSLEHLHYYLPFL